MVWIFTRSTYEIAKSPTNEEFYKMFVMFIREKHLPKTYSSADLILVLEKSTLG
jgi:hypothetical protein